MRLVKYHCASGAHQMAFLKKRATAYFWLTKKEQLLFFYS